MRISDWSSDVCSSDLFARVGGIGGERERAFRLRDCGIIDEVGGDGVERRLRAFGIAREQQRADQSAVRRGIVGRHLDDLRKDARGALAVAFAEHALAHFDQRRDLDRARGRLALRSEEHTSELQSLMRNSYAVFCLKKKTTSRTP